MTDAGDAAAGSNHETADPEPQTEELLRFAKQRKRDANARHRARKKAVQADPDSWHAAIQQQVEAERRRLAELNCEEAALNAMAAYQQEAMQVLEFANFAERVGGEVAYMGAAAAPPAAAAPAPAAEQPADEQDWVALYAASLVPVEQVEHSVRGAQPPGAAGAAQQVQRQAAQQAPRQAAAWEIGELEESGYISSRSGSGSYSSRARVNTLSGATATGATGGAAGGAAHAAPASPAAHSAAAARNSSQAAAANAPAGEFATAAAVAADSASARNMPREAGSSARAHSGGQQPKGANEVLEQMKLGPEDRGLMDLLMEEQRVVKHWYFAGSSLVRASIVRVAAMALSVLPVSVISQRNKAYMAQLQHTVQRWEACPGSRRQIEEILGARLVDRQVLMRHLAHKRPKALLEVWAGVTCPPPPPGTPSIGGRPLLHPVLLPIAQFLEANLSPAKKAQLEHDWHKYQKDMGAAVEMRVQASARLQYAAAVQAVSWQKQSMLPKGGSTAERSQAYVTMTDSAGCLVNLESRELIALLDLQEALMRVLTPIQMARVFMTSYPYNPDMTRICPWLFAKLPPSPPPQLQPPSTAPGHFIAPMPSQPTFPMSGQEFGRPAAQAGSHLLGAVGLVPVGGADVAGADVARADLSNAAGPAPPAGLASAAVLASDSCQDAEGLLELLDDDELDFLIADLAGGDVGHLLAGTNSPRLP